MKKNSKSQDSCTSVSENLRTLLCLCRKDEEETQNAVCRIEQGAFQTLETKRTSVTFAPLHYEPNYAYPLIVWLHAPGEDERQLLRVMPILSLRNYMAVAVRGSVSFGMNGLPKPGFYWDSTTYEPTFSAVLGAVAMVRQKYNIASNRIYLVGCGDGGTMAQRLVLRNPNCFNGVVSLDGAVPEDMMLLENFRELHNVRFFYALSHGPHSCQPEAVYDNLRVLYAAGVRLSLRTYSGTSSIQADMLRDIDRWIMGGIDSALL